MSRHIKKIVLHRASMNLTVSVCAVSNKNKNDLEIRIPTLKNPMTATSLSAIRDSAPVTPSRVATAGPVRFFNQLTMSSACLPAARRQWQKKILKNYNTRQLERSCASRWCAASPKFTPEETTLQKECGGTKKTVLLTFSVLMKKKGGSSFLWGFKLTLIKYYNTWGELMISDFVPSLL